MEPRRIILFLAISLAILIGWTQFVVPLLVPRQANQPPAADAADDGNADDALAGDDAQPAGDLPGLVEPPVVAPVPKEDGSVVPNEGGIVVGQQPAAQPRKLARHPRQTVILGSLDPETGYFAAVGTTTTGAAVDYIRLNDKRYCKLNDRQTPLEVVGNGQTDFRTLESSIPQIDEQLKPFKARLKDVNWEVADKTADPQLKGIDNSVTYRYVSPDGKLEVRKKYTLERVEGGGGERSRARDKVRNTETKGYQLRLDLTVSNLAGEPQSVGYLLQGPVGLPLEDTVNSRTFRSVRAAFLDTDEQDVPREKRDIKYVTESAKSIAKADEEDEIEEWKSPFRYIGVDVQFFAALLLPQGDQLKTPYISVAKATLIKEGTDNKGKAHPAFSDVSVQLTSSDLKLKPQGQPGSSVTHSFRLYAGPKRDDLLEPISADNVINYGWFPFGSAIMGFISHSLVSLLSFMHDKAYIPYGIAIVILTIMVRGCMFPISRKQAAGAKKMKELQPKIAELKKKYANDKEKFARAQMELFSKHNYNPLAGCLPIVLQMPVFIGLYQALRNAVDLRMAPFLWFENLAAPDAMFRLPFEIPFLGTSDFNLLPLLTVGLFIAQQQIFMPPPTDDQQKMQQKMMKFMMIFMGFMFYKVPAGLCVYFIASSLWGLAERKTLDYGKAAGKLDETEPADGQTESQAAAGASQKKAAAKTDKRAGRKGLLERLFAAADAAAQASRSESQSNGQSDGQSRRDRKKKRKKTRR